MKVAVTGSTGFVGSRLVERLLAENHQVVAFTRNGSSAERVLPKSENLEIVAYSPKEAGDWQSKIAGCDGVVNLAGEPIAENRWTPELKKTLLESRTLTTQNVVNAIAQANPKPSVLVNASAIGFYGTSETASFDENSASGQDFLAEVCRAWEAEANKVKESGTRLVILRIGIVLENGGALGKMLAPFKMFAGGPIGSGKQWFSWIHREDLVSLIIRALTSGMEGVYNATAPTPVKMAELTNTLGQVMNRPSWLPVPGFALEAMLGDGAIVVLEGQQVLPKRTLESGFEYAYPTVKQALEAILK
ncbi:MULTISPECIES: thylakoid membrane protein ThyD [Leptolyngbya]|uniref:thylakoid membrane protein ThyD n=1 Tax=Leptolyngbya TaxID=47251 RepID=UPI0016887878|nr:MULTISPECIES: TIGR01777 family oxidoreductase [unclassified Leptolyngbya]MBD1859072.1 TIGR01777 family protein [Leptolyngbya sp. FACHB-1624]MBN8563920.1 TIGR01777 family oxidoreductase [Leptolyngbya sp. UWPOB_LEPTO1]MCY6494118.1 TIGR01777 family oxidoreductase [Leptolyngbya sp. GGD]